MIAIVAFVISFSLGKIFAKKHGYKINPSKELVAQGSSSLFGSFFLSLPISGSLSRSAIQDEAGCRSMMTSLVSVVILGSTLLFAGPYFRPLPNVRPSASFVTCVKLTLNHFRPSWRRSSWSA